MNAYSNKRQMETLFLKLLENTITDAEVRQMDEYFAAHPERLKDYCEFVVHYNAVRTKFQNEIPSAVNSFLMDSAMDEKFWGELAHEEKSAPKIELPPASKEPPQDESAKPLRKTAPPVSRFSLVSLLLSSAALVFVFLYAFFATPGRGIEVATVSDTLNARWAKTEPPIQNGTRLVTKSDPLYLHEGAVKLAFDNGCTLLLEGPAQFEILTEDQIYLRYGRLYAAVPAYAVGFIVSTANSKIIDLGTEFGVKVDLDGQTEVHVLQGKTLLISGAAGDPKNQYEVSRGQAKAIAQNGLVQDIPLKKDAFIRNIHSQTGFVWKGQRRLDLADVVGGGNGFGTGQLDVGLNPVSGECVSRTTANRRAANDYKLVAFHPFVDGVFVPNGSTPQIVSSMGHLFQDCPPTQGLYFTEILNTPDRLDGQWMALGDIQYGLDDNRCLFLHANIGITFDLEAIRSQLPGARISRFRSEVGISRTALRDANADFWVLVDGQVRYGKQKVQQKGLLETLDIELSDTDRFLTLVVTDGGDPDERKLPNGFVRRSIDCDWGVFGSPVLILE